MFGFNKKKKKVIAQHDTGYNHGLAFINDQTKWVVPLEDSKGVLVTGSTADETGVSLINAFNDATDITYMMDFMGTGLVSGLNVDYKADTLDKATAMMDSIKTRMMETGTDSDGPWPLLVVNGVKPADVKAFAGDSADIETKGETGSPENPDLDAPSLDIAYSKESLYEMLGEDTADNVENAIKACSVDGRPIDTQPAVVVRWSVMDKVSLTDAGNHGVHVPESAIIADAVESLKFRESESVRDWAERQSDNPTTTQAALVLTQCDDRIGLPWPPMGTPEERKDAIAYLQGRITKYRNNIQYKELTPLQTLWSDVATMLRVSDTLGVTIVIIATEPDLDALAEILPSIQVRVISGSLDKKDEWVAGTVNESDIIDYGTGDLQVVSPAKIGRLHTTIGTLRSPYMYKDKTMITII